jgi:hypothetical protein
MVKKLFLFSSEHVVYEGDEWALIRDGDSMRSMTNLYGTHSVCTLSYEPDEHSRPLQEGSHHYGEYCWLILENAACPVCVICGSGVPAEFQAMVVLYREGMKGAS